MAVNGRKIVVIVKDDQGKPDLGQVAAGAGLRRRQGRRSPSARRSSGAALAMLPVAEEHKKILIVEPAVADPITGDKWNRYIFRTGAQFDAGRARRRRGARQAAKSRSRRWRRTMPSAATASPRSRRRSQPPEQAKWCSRNTRRRPNHRLHRLGAAHLRRAEGQARPQDHLVSSGPAPHPLPRSWISSRSASASRSPPGGNILPVLKAYKDYPAWKAPSTTTTASPRTR